MSYGLLERGFSPKTTAIVREDMNADLRGRWGASFAVSDSDPVGQLLSIVAAVAGSLWALAQALYSGQSRDAATGALLDAILLLIGTLRAPAAASTVTLTLFGTNGTVVSSGSRVKSASVASTIFATNADATIATLDSWAAVTAYVVDDRVTNSGNAYVCITAGTSAGAGGPTTTAADITDGTVHWRYMGAGTAVVDVAATCTVTGPVVAVAGDLTTIDTPVGGWATVTNLEDATPGRNVATDAEARIQGEADLARAGATTQDAIRETLLQVDGVTSVTVFHNATDATVDTIPPHAVEPLVLGGDDQGLFDAVYGSCVAAGIASHGTETGAALDSEGVSHVVKFSRPSLLPMWVTIYVTKRAYSATDRRSYPLDGDDQVAAAIVAFGDEFLCGDNVESSALAAQAFAVTGVLKVTACHIDDSPSPTLDTAFLLDLRTLATFDTSRVVVVSVDGAP